MQDEWAAFGVCAQARAPGWWPNLAIASSASSHGLAKGWRLSCLARHLAETLSYALVVIAELGFSNQADDRGGKGA